MNARAPRGPLPTHGSFNQQTEESAGRHKNPPSQPWRSTSRVLFVGENQRAFNRNFSCSPSCSLGDSVPRPDVQPVWKSGDRPIDGAIHIGRGDHRVELRLPEMRPHPRDLATGSDDDHHHFGAPGCNRDPDPIGCPSCLSESQRRRSERSEHAQQPALSTRTADPAI